jgi:hypothetical protein
MYIALHQTPAPHLNIHHLFSHRQPHTQHAGLDLSVNNHAKDSSKYKTFSRPLFNDKKGIDVTCRGATVLAEALSQNSSLTHLALHGHKINGPGERALASSITHHRHIMKSGCMVNLLRGCARALMVENSCQFVDVPRPVDDQVLSCGLWFGS